MAENQETKTGPCPECGEDHAYPVELNCRGVAFPREAPVCELCAARAREARWQARVEVAKSQVLANLTSLGVSPLNLHATFDNFEVSGSETPVLAAQEFLSAVVERIEFREKKVAEFTEVIRSMDYSGSQFGQLSDAQWLEVAASLPVTRGLFLCGPVGTGKTHLAVAVARELLLDPRWSPNEVVFDRAGRLILEIQDSYSSGGTLQAMAIREKAGLWVLDDLGAEKPTEDVVRVLTELIAAREGLPTLLTSNFEPKDLLKRYPAFERVVSRLGPKCFRVVRVSGKDHRQIPLDVA